MAAIAFFRSHTNTYLADLENLYGLTTLNEPKSKRLLTRDEFLPKLLL